MVSSKLQRMCIEKLGNFRRGNTWGEMANLEVRRYPWLFVKVQDTLNSLQPCLCKINNFLSRQLCLNKALICTFYTMGPCNNFN